MCDMTHECIHVCDMAHCRVWYDSFTCAVWLVATCDMAHSHVRHDSLLCATWLSFWWLFASSSQQSAECRDLCDMTHEHVWHDSLTCVMWLIVMCVMTNFPVGSLEYRLHNKAVSAVICMTWLTTMFDRVVAMCDITQFLVVIYIFFTANFWVPWPVWHDSSTSVTYFIHTWRDSFKCDMTHPNVWQNLFIRDVTPSYVTCLTPIYDMMYFRCEMGVSRVTWLIPMFICDMTHSHVHMWHDSLPCSYVTWLTPICNMMYSKCERIQMRANHVIQMWGSHANESLESLTFAGYYVFQMSWCYAFQMWALNDHWNRSQIPNVSESCRT